MSVLIKGMEIPKNCLWCKFSECEIANEYWCMLLNRYIEFDNKHRDEDCPLVDIPVPHGRLIDADALMRKTVISRKLNNHKDMARRLMHDSEHWHFQNIISQSSTIIEEE